MDDMIPTLDRPGEPPMPAPLGPAGHGDPHPSETTPRSGRLGRIVRGPADDLAWARPALLGLLGATAVLYLWGLGASGWANSFYSAAVQAGTKSWKAMFFGSSDAANSITVDKPPASLWLMEVSARIFGVSSWSILVPQALAGVASVGVLYAAVKRWFGAGAGLVAAAILATTPVAALMFRFNNPDALLTLLLVGAAYALVRALEVASTRWLVLAWSLVGLGFLTKMLQALLVAPAFALVYLLAAPTSLRRRIVQSAWGFLALVASAGWWVLIVALWPASSRPYIGGSQNNSIVDLIVGYNGLGRLTGNETGSVGGGGPGGPGGGGGGSMWGPTGWYRMLNDAFGAQASWLLPTAMVLLAAGLWLTRRAPRTDRARAALIIWGGWLLVTAVAFSFGQGIIHEYYTVVLAPAIGALVGIGLVPWWRRRHLWSGRLVLAGSALVTAWWSYELLHRTPDWAPVLQAAVLMGGLAAAALLLLPDLPRRAAIAVGALALVVGLAGPTAYALQTASTPHSGSLPTAGPGQGRGPGGRGGPGGPGGPGGFGPMGGPMMGNGTTGFPPGMGTGTMPGGTGTMPGGTGSMPGGTGTMPGGTGSMPGFGLMPEGMGTMAGGPGGGAGGLLDASAPSDELTALLEQDADRYTWVAATTGAQSAAGYQLATDDPVMPIGGFNGSDPSPTLEQFQAYVAAGKIHYYLAGGGGPGGGMGMGGPMGGFGGDGQGGGFGASMGGSRASSEIASWVASNYTAKTVGGITVYDLTAPTTSS
jgi:4-amino-4-deoxy-L-arabinose transferase-like glycosyltransferase